MTKTKILFVCLGNICRSPSAQGVFEKLIKEKGVEHLFEVDSAGTHSYHVGGSPDSRSIHHASLRGIDISKQIARSIQARDFDYFDYIIAMDNANYETLLAMCPGDELEVKIYEMMSFAQDTGYIEVPDPYDGGGKGFELVLNLLENATQGLLRSL